jgi:transcriptional regulator with XRE-family HTH domain
MERQRDPFCIEVGRRLERRRRLLGLTQREVAERLGFHTSYVSQLEQGVRQGINMRKLAALADVLGTSLDYLLLRVEEDPGVIPPRRGRGAEVSVDGHASLPPTYPFQEASSVVF